MRIVLFIPLLALFAAGCGQQKLNLEITVPDGPPSMSVPAETTMPNPVKQSASFEGFINNGAPIYAQEAPAVLTSSDGSKMERAIITIIPDHVMPQSVSLSGTKRETPFELQEREDGRLWILEEGKPVLAYNFGMQLPEGVAADRKRSSYIYPVYDLNGTNLLDDFPSDHYHHRGISWMWPKLIAGSDTVSTWDIRGAHQIFEKWLARETGPVAATVGVHNTWKILDRKSVDEYVWFRVYKSNDLGRVIDIALTFISSEPILITQKDYKAYGGFCVRFARRKNVEIISPDGPLNQDILREHWAWADQSANYRGSDKVSGLAVFQHKDNPDFPADWILRHYGFTGVSWPGLKNVTMEPGQPVHLKYRVWIHNGNAEDGKVAEVYKFFKNDNLVKIE